MQIARRVAALIASIEVHAILAVLATWRAPAPVPSGTAPAAPLDAYLLEIQREPELESPSQGPRAPSTHPGRSTPHPSPTLPPGPPPPPAARAAPIVATTVPPPPEAPPVVTDTAPSFPGGVTQAGAWSPEPIEDPLARAWGLLDGTGTGGGGGWGDRSRRARLGGDKHWPCKVPAFADFDHAVAQVVADVDAQGRALRIEVVDDPFHLADVARPCAMNERYVAALDASGRPIRGKTLPFRIVFDR
jgi:hypothetical protein